MDQEEKDKIRNKERFSGYQLPKIQLDETGSTYYDVSPHPYFYNQPAYWTPAVFSGHPNSGSESLNNDIPTTADTAPVINRSIEGIETTNKSSKSNGSGLYSFLSLN